MDSLRLTAKSVVALAVLAGALIVVPSASSITYWLGNSGWQLRVSWDFGDGYAPGSCISMIDLATQPYVTGGGEFAVENVVDYIFDPPGSCNRQGEWISARQWEHGVTYYARVQRRLPNGFTLWSNVWSWTAPAAPPPPPAPTNKTPRMNGEWVAPTGNLGKRLKMRLHLRACDGGNAGLRLLIRERNGRRDRTTSKFLGRVDGCRTFNINRRSSIPLTNGRHYTITFWLSDTLDRSRKHTESWGP